MLTLKDEEAWLTTNTLNAPGAAPEGAENAASLLPPLDPVSPEDWMALVSRVADGIRHHRLGVDKVVLARAHTVPAIGVDPVEVVRRLAQAYPSCTVFAIDYAGVCFIGATPERLVSLHHGTASTMALAGSFARGATPREDQAQAERLLHNPKERAEHAFVVRALRDGLAGDGLCTRIMADAEPRVRTLANVQHLFTPIRGQVAPGRGVLDLVQSLHPSPAVGGVPRQQALELIRHEERLDRGWYAGAIGWLDSQAEGEFVVGIRSALLRQDTATLFAGCGIVADSNAAAEFAESEWKLRPMRAALGLEDE
jgi:isochorismate synthase